MAPAQQIGLYRRTNRDEVQMLIAPLLCAVVGGLTLAGTGWLAGLPFDLTPLSYVVGMTVTLAWASKILSDETAPASDQGGGPALDRHRGSAAEGPRSRPGPARSSGTAALVP